LAINREQSLELLDFFDECLHLFGSYQDAMTPNEWSLYHLDCLFDEYQDDFATEVIEKIQTLASNPDKIEYNQLEGFVRQIIGWRVHARYLLVKNAEYATMNFFNNEKKLPDWFWTGKTMNCLKTPSINL
jgi:deoxyribodipyrimidine photolyase-related protein